MTQTTQKTEADAEVITEKTGRHFSQIVVVMVVLLVLVNIPIGWRELGLAQQMTSHTSIIIEDGTILQPYDSPDLYLLSDHTLRLITPTSRHKIYFQAYQRQVVPPEILTQFAFGEPIYQRLQCKDGAMYGWDGQAKRRLPAPTISAHPWDTVASVSCAFLDSLPTVE